MSLSLKLLILPLAVAALPAADKDNARFAPGPAASYATRQTIDKVSIAGVPYHTPERAREAFGKLKLSENGVLPVLVVSLSTQPIQQSALPTFLRGSW